MLMFVEMKDGKIIGSIGCIIAPSSDKEKVLKLQIVNEELRIVDEITVDVSEIVGISTYEFFNYWDI